MLTRSKTNSDSHFIQLNKNPRKHSVKKTSYVIDLRIISGMIYLGLICFAYRSYWIPYAHTNFTLV